MRFTVRLGKALTVWAEGRERPPPPDRAVATLLLGLLAAGEGWTSRAEVARRLYPESDPAAARNALRQALFRLRRWLDAEVVDSQGDLLRLVPGAVASIWEEDVASWLDHPWAHAIQSAREASVLPTASHFTDFARAVESAAEVDRDAARGILVGGAALALNMPGEAALRLVSLTASANARSPFAFEHLDLRGEIHLHTMAFDQAKETYLRAYRLAAHRRNAAKATRAAAMATFVHIESGDMAGAAAWLERCATHGRPETPLLANVRAAFLWNSDRLDEAVALMRDARPDPSTSNALTRLHYWTNFAALASESGDPDLALHADGEARRLAVPSVHLFVLRTLDFARATRLMRQGLLDESLRAFQALRTRAERTGYAAQRAYAEEGYAEALARAGEGRQAAQVWWNAEAVRRATNGRLTPRLAARKARVLRTNPLGER